MEIFRLDLASLFVIEASVSELIVRGVILYLGILLLFRVLPRRTGGELEFMDLVFVLLIAEAATHAFGEYSSITEAFIVIATLMGMNNLVNRLSYHSKFIARLVESKAIQIVKDGKMLRRNMRREFLTQDELYEQLRKEGVEDIQEVKKAFIESDGTISVITKDKK
ncbi:DUF421 domain-containing protein [Adhaeribacter sp. BT258]|uniref:DUF421 domain-containing protein n=1 Tax=Adhaeribacter terrigena TaxID=2793070 RepID=A0ABS1C290_9BACT|nr:YetF domain-containing protein [Adhaeribacter terrigena]MBK0402680.1 DUF421 domain-containing protein [Adhaeribacter terrigena]